MSKISLSTAWNAKKKKDAELIVEEIRDAGFDSIELYFTLSKDVVDGISSIIKRGDITVKTLHNYCPIPEEIKPNQVSPDYYPLSSLDEDERKKGILYTKQTIEKAQELGAKAVVIHCGRVDAKDHSKKLIALYEEGKVSTNEFRKIRDDMFLSRKAISEGHMNASLKSLDELNSFASKKGIIVGIENRFYFMEMPSVDEIGIILAEFKGSSISYWHDTGHAQVNESLGFARHIDFLDRYAGQMAGIHLHDVKGTEDHLAPGQGDFDFSLLVPYLKPDIIKVIEAHDVASKDDLKHAREYLQKTLDGVI